jgi:hypothetical protein
VDLSTRVHSLRQMDLMTEHLYDRRSDQSIMLSEQLKVSQLVNYSKEQMKNRLEEIQVYSIMKNTMDEKGVFKMG